MFALKNCYTCNLTSTWEKQLNTNWNTSSAPRPVYSTIFLITPTGLSQWFADNVDNEGNTYFFTWNGVEEEAELLTTDDDDSIRFRWDYYDDDEFFEFRIEQGEITGDTILYITDFAEPNEVDSQKALWILRSRI